MFEISEIEQPTQVGNENNFGRNLVDQVEITKVKCRKLCVFESVISLVTKVCSCFV